MGNSPKAAFYSDTYVVVRGALIFSRLFSLFFAVVRNSIRYIDMNFCSSFLPLAKSEREQMIASFAAPGADTRPGTTTGFYTTVCANNERLCILHSALVLTSEKTTNTARFSMSFFKEDEDVQKHLRASVWVVSVDLAGQVRVVQSVAMEVSAICKRSYFDSMCASHLYQRELLGNIYFAFSRRVGNCPRIVRCCMTSDPIHLLRYQSTGDE